MSEDIRDSIKKVLEDHEDAIRILSKNDSIIVARALIDPPEPNEKLKEIFKRFHKGETDGTS